MSPSSAGAWLVEVDSGIAADFAQKDGPSRDRTMDHTIVLSGETQ
jgi:hypothetical protein